MNDKKRITFSLNGEKREFDIRVDETLADLLRRSGMKSVKQGCGEASCGACTVIMDGKAVYSCILYACQAQGRSIWTVEGLGSFDRPHPIQQALVEEGAVQCGYCIPGMILSVKAMLDANPSPGREEIREQMDGNLCRCTGYEKIWTAILKVAGSRSGGGA
jgi:aerobic-type carbon monoxide dehydrogenase small subunit (CoxS/CutS family)